MLLADAVVFVKKRQATYFHWILFFRRRRDLLQMEGRVQLDNHRIGSIKPTCLSPTLSLALCLKQNQIIFSSSRG